MWQMPAGGGAQCLAVTALVPPGLHTMCFATLPRVTKDPLNHTSLFHEIEMVMPASLSCGDSNRDTHHRAPGISPSSGDSGAS